MMIPHHRAPGAHHCQRKLIAGLALANAFWMGAATTAVLVYLGSKIPQPPGPPGPERHRRHGGPPGGRGECRSHDHPHRKGEGGQSHGCGCGKRPRQVDIDQAPPGEVGDVDVPDVADTDDEGLVR